MLTIKALHTFSLQTVGSRRLFSCEIWKDISEFERYQVSTHGKIRLKKNMKHMKLGQRSHGQTISLHNDTGLKKNLQISQYGYHRIAMTEQGHKKNSFRT